MGVESLIKVKWGPGPLLRDQLPVQRWEADSIATLRSG